MSTWSLIVSHSAVQCKMLGIFDMRGMLPGWHLQPLCLCCILVIQGSVQGPIKPGAELFARLFIIFEAVMTPCDWSGSVNKGLWLADIAACYLCFEGAITQCDREQVCIYFYFYWDTRGWDGRHASKYIWVRRQVCGEQSVMWDDATMLKKIYWEQNKEIIFKLIGVMLLTGVPSHACELHFLSWKNISSVKVFPQSITLPKNITFYEI